MHNFQIQLGGVVLLKPEFVCFFNGRHLTDSGRPNNGRNLRSMFGIKCVDDIFLFGFNEGLEIR